MMALASVQNEGGFDPGDVSSEKLSPRVLSLSFSSAAHPIAASLAAIPSEFTNLLRVRRNSGL
jgi:hypothetical protein